ncbi:MAG: arylsulfatase, partial [Planctomycetales bacterium]|nr:arylsulfatase [Planctomycetales bacterium]
MQVDVERTQFGICPRSFSGSPRDGRNGLWLPSVALLAFSVLNMPVIARGAERPNIILVMADDLGWSDIGCYGGEIKTPHIDSLARDGIRFTQFYNNAVCGPTRASLLTGLYCQQVGHSGAHWNQPKDYSKCVLLSEVLQRAGYATAMVGKWQGRDSAIDRGFDRFWGPMCQAKISYFHEVQQNPYYLNRERWQPPDDFYLTESINGFAEQFLREATASEKPFFLYVAHIAPHWPLHAREADVAEYRELYQRLGWDDCRRLRHERQLADALIPAAWDTSPMPTGIPRWSREKHPQWQAERMAVYAAQVTAIDRGLGRLLRVIDESGQRDNTLVMFLSDNGAAPDGGVGPTTSGFGFAPTADNSNWRTDRVPIQPGSGPMNLPGGPETFAAYGLAWATASNTPLRSTKLSGYEGGIRTPLIARWPATIQASSRTNQVGHVIDMMATCLDVSSVQYPQEFDARKPLPIEGKSLLPAFRGETQETHDVICWSVPRHYVIRMGHWKAIRGRQAEHWELYDLESDGTETTDLASKHPEIVERLAERFSEWQRRVG